MDRNELLKQLTILDFIAVDLGLYLDTHPNDADAIENYNSVVAEANDTRTRYEQHFGPLCSFRSMSKGAWTWIDKPWPWDKDFNFEVKGEGNYHVGI